jgi:hypothetical protein
MLDRIVERILGLRDGISIVKCERVRIYQVMDLKHIWCSQVCSEIIQTSSYLQFKIDLQSVGYVDNPAVKLPVSEGLELLRSKVRLWKKLDWTKHSTYTLKFEGTLRWWACRGLLLRI